MTLIQEIREAAAKAITALFGQAIPAVDLTVNTTKPEFEGDYTLVTFSLTRFSRKSPEETGRQLGDYLTGQHGDLFSHYNVVKGFLNLTVSDDYWLKLLWDNFDEERFGRKPSEAPADGGRSGQEGVSPSPARRIMIEYSSPNTNKPLHLGHLRNNFLGYALAEILKADGNEVIKANLVNDRGIHICKSMVAWEMFAGGATPASTGIKGDHFVGDYYVKFNEVYKEQVAELTAGGMDGDTAEKEAPIMKAAQEMLRKWEQHDPVVRELWETMNSWVYEGFDETYRRLGIDFDKVYYESNTYLLGKELVTEGLQKGVLHKKEDGSVWIDLTGEGLDEKLLLRADGTSVYITQDLGTARVKYEDCHMEQSIYVVADEQNYHFRVLELILRQLQEPGAEGLYHLSYGMVELPTGKMKSREGTVVDADDFVDEMIQTAARHTRELGKVSDFTEEELERLYETIGLGAMKFYLLRVDPKKKMVFNPEASIDFHGFTGPFIQYTYARIQSILRRGPLPTAEELEDFRKTADNDLTGITADKTGDSYYPLEPLEKALLIQLEQFRSAISTAAAEMDPSVIANYAYTLAKTFNSFYAEHSVSKAENNAKRVLRMLICMFTAHVLKAALMLLGIRVPARM